MTFYIMSFHLKENQVRLGFTSQTDGTETLLKKVMVLKP